MKEGILVDPNLEKIASLGKVKHRVNVGNSSSRMVVVMIPVAVAAAAAAEVVVVVARRSSCSNGVKRVGLMVGTQ